MPVYACYPAPVCASLLPADMSGGSPLTSKANTRSDRPADLVNVQEAGRLVDRSVSTIRAWVRKGELEGFRQDPRRKNSRLMVSRRSLLALAGLTKEPEPARPGGAPREPSMPGPGEPDSPTTGAELLTVELEGARALVEALRGQVANLEEQARRERERAEEWKDRATAAEAQQGALWEQLREREAELEGERREVRTRLRDLERQLQAAEERGRVPIWRRLLKG
jgi:hypothetical protein